MSVERQYQNEIDDLKEKLKEAADAFRKIVVATEEGDGYYSVMAIQGIAEKMLELISG